MIEVDGTATLIGPQGPVTLLETFEGRRQLIAYYFMWRTGRPAPEQYEGCTRVTAQVRELSYLHSRDVTYATFCQGPYEESARYCNFMGWEMPWYPAPPRTHLRASWLDTGSAGCISSATCGKGLMFSRLIGPPLAGSM